VSSHFPSYPVCSSLTRLRFQVAIESGSSTLSSSKPYTLRVSFKQAYPGRYEDRLEFFFQDTLLKERFIITRTLKAVVGDKALFHELTPKSPYIPPQQSAKKEIGEFIGGVKPTALKAIQYKIKLAEAAIPKPLHDLLSGPEPIVRITKKIKENFFPEPLANYNYGRFFQRLLWVEEMKMEYVPGFFLYDVISLCDINRQDLIKYDMTEVLLTRHNIYY